MNENAVLYALSTLAQTCAALAAFVGAVGLFRLQALREGYRSAEQNLRSAVVVGGLMGSGDARIQPLARVLHQVEQARANPSGVTAGGGFPPIEEAFNAWNVLGPRLRRISKALVVFEAWNLFVILISLGGFAHVPALICRSWTTPAVWIVAIVTAAISGVSVFVWLERE